MSDTLMFGLRSLLDSPNVSPAHLANPSMVSAQRTMNQLKEAIQIDRERSKAEFNFLKRGARRRAVRLASPKNIVKRSNSMSPMPVRPVDPMLKTPYGVVTEMALDLPAD